MANDSIPKAQHGPPPAEAAAAETRLKGHLGHLTREEQIAFDSFKSICAEKGFYTPATTDAKASHDDGTLVRYLRARKFVPQDAFVQFSDTENWRKENDLDALYEKIDIHDYWESRSVYPQWTGRRDKRGIPVYLYEVGKLDSKKMTTYTSSTSKSKTSGPAPSRMLRLFALYENLTRFVMPLCSAVPGRPNPETPVDQSNNIVDISKVGLKQFWNLRSHMQDASTLATAHYPETLDRIFIIGAPSFFPTVWGWIKKWFDPITTSKIFILSHHQVLPTLTSFIEIENIPKKYGGELDFECGKMPVLDTQVRNCLSIEAGAADNERFFLTAPVRWIDAGEDGEMTALGVGSIEGKQRKNPVATLYSMATRVATSESAAQMTAGATAQIQAIAVDDAATTANIQKIAADDAATTANQQAANQQAMSTRSDTATTAMEAVSLQSAPPSGRPTSIQPAPEANLATASIHDQPVPAAGEPLQHPIQNGAPPESIKMPPPPIPMERTKTEFMTPLEDPSDLKQLQ